ncbi:MAG: hypothetical protein O3A84_05875 [Proteobacteria bacterium]|nr:hypothetical protein [Pseudomonadota bacterium]
MRLLTAAAALIIPTLTMGTSAGAETFRPDDIRPGTAIHGYVLSDAYYQEMARVAQYWDKRETLDCGQRYKIKLVRLMVREPIEKDATAAHPTGGRWQYRFSATRCDQTKLFNMQVTAAPNGLPSVEPMMPGASFTNPQLQRSAMLKAQQGAAALNPEFANCKDEDAFISDRKVAVPPRELGHGLGGWEEEWTIFACGKKFVAPVEFIQGGTKGPVVNSPPNDYFKRQKNQKK